MVSTTSRDHFKTYDAATWYSNILSLMREDTDRAWCIADIARALGAQKSTISARLNELVSFNDIEYYDTFKSRTTGVKSKHYRISDKQSLI